MIKSGKKVLPAKKTYTKNALPFCTKCYVRNDVHETRKCVNKEILIKLGKMITSE